MAMPVPGQCGHAVAQADAHPAQRIGEAAGAGLDLGVGGAVDRPLDRPGDHFGPGMMTGGVADDAADQQRLVLHQAEHGTGPQMK